MSLNLAVCVEPNKDPTEKHDYRVWYLEMDNDSNVTGIAVKTKSELIACIMLSIRTGQKPNWRCFQKDMESSTKIDLFDFIAMNTFQNTHFGQLPTLSEFQTTLNALENNFEMKAIA